LSLYSAGHPAVVSKSCSCRRGVSPTVLRMGSLAPRPQGHRQSAHSRIRRSCTTRSCPDIRGTRHRLPSSLGSRCTSFQSHRRPGNPAAIPQFRRAFAHWERSARPYNALRSPRPSMPRLLSLRPLASGGISRQRRKLVLRFLSCPTIGPKQGHPSATRGLERKFGTKGTQPRSLSRDRNMGSL